MLWESTTPVYLTIYSCCSQRILCHCSYACTCLNHLKFSGWSAPFFRLGWTSYHTLHRQPHSCYQISRSNCHHHSSWVTSGNHQWSFRPCPSSGHFKPCSNRCSASHESLHSSENCKWRYPTTRWRGMSEFMCMLHVRISHLFSFPTALWGGRGLVWVWAKTLKNIRENEKMLMALGLKAGMCPLAAPQNQLIFNTHLNYTWT